MIKWKRCVNSGSKNSFLTQCYLSIKFYCRAQNPNDHFHNCNPTLEYDVREERKEDDDDDDDHISWECDCCKLTDGTAERGSQ